MSTVHLRPSLHAPLCLLTPLFPSNLARSFLPQADPSHVAALTGLADLLALQVGPLSERLGESLRLGSVVIKSGEEQLFE